MKKISQQDLLNEAVWDTVAAGGKLLGGIAGGATKGIAKGLDYVAPELTKPIHDVERAVKDISGEVVDRFLRLWQGKKRFIAQNLLDASYMLSLDKKMKRLKGNNVLVYATKIIDIDEKGNPVLDRYVGGKRNGQRKYTPLIVDSITGEIKKNITQARTIGARKKT